MGALCPFRSLPERRLGVNARRSPGSPSLARAAGTGPALLTKSGSGQRCPGPSPGHWLRGWARPQGPRGSLPQSSLAQGDRGRVLLRAGHAHTGPGGGPSWGVRAHNRPLVRPAGSASQGRPAGCALIAEAAGNNGRTHSYLPTVCSARLGAQGQPLTRHSPRVPRVPPAPERSANRSA